MMAMMLAWIVCTSFALIDGYYTKNQIQKSVIKHLFNKKYLPVKHYLMLVQDPDWSYNEYGEFIPHVMFGLRVFYLTYQKQISDSSQTKFSYARYTMMQWSEARLGSYNQNGYFALHFFITVQQSYAIFLRDLRRKALYIYVKYKIDVKRRNWVMTGLQSCCCASDSCENSNSFGSNVLSLYK